MLRKPLLMASIHPPAPPAAPLARQTSLRDLFFTEVDPFSYGSAALPWHQKVKFVLMAPIALVRMIMVLFSLVAIAAWILTFSCE